MDLVTFISTNYLTLGGIISFIFACGYTYSSFRSIEKSRDVDRKAYNLQREQDYKDFESQLKEQKKDHDEKITILFTQTATNTAKIDTVKDETMKAIQGIQLDVREIMTILKGQK